jgi:7-cyano-7-deazaguanine synthase
MAKTVLIYSGGLDSTALLWSLLREKDELRCLGIDYGQRHSKELQAARAICGSVGVAFQTADIRGIRPLLAGSALTDDIPVPEGHYEAEMMRQTIVPNRNMLMLSLGIAWCVSLGFDRVAYAAHAGDHTIYPDCRPEFIGAMRQAAALCDWRKVDLYAPFVEKTKAEIVRIGVELGAPFEMTWSCYKGREKHCGKCGTCVERREAFELAGVSDPTEYEEGVG